MLHLKALQHCTTLFSSELVLLGSNQEKCQSKSVTVSVTFYGSLSSLFHRVLLSHPNSSLFLRRLCKDFCAWHALWPDMSVLSELCPCFIFNNWCWCVYSTLALSVPLMLWIITFQCGQHFLLVSFSVIDVEMCKQKDSAPKIMATESVLLKVWHCVCLDCFWTLTL